MRGMFFLIAFLAAFQLWPTSFRSGALPSEIPSLPLEAQIGQMIMVGFHGSCLEPDHPLRKDITRRHLGGVILFNRGPDPTRPSGNILSLSQLQALTRDLQSLSPTPLLIAVDQEGGRVCRLDESCGFPPTPSFAWLGQTDDPALTRRHAATIAGTLREAGINLNFSPVVDLDSNPNNPIIGGLERSFSANPRLVAVHAREVVLAHRAEGLLTALKHFPGHGSSEGDTHRSFVDVTRTWCEKELQPFSTLIEEDLADTIMTAHVFNARLDPDYPATLSAKTLQGLLRERLGYDGVILSDDLGMKAISSNYPLDEVLEKAVNAGIDILLLADPAPDTAARTIKLIRKLVSDGRIDPARIDQAYRRIARLKARLVDRQMTFD